MGWGTCGFAVGSGWCCVGGSGVWGVGCGVGRVGAGGDGGLWWGG